MNNELVEITEKVCAFLAFFTNSIILLLIIFKSPKTLGTYKYLMIYISLFEVFYAVLNLLSPSQVFTLGSGFLVVMDQKNAILPVGVCILLYFTMFGTSLANFGVHFIYRYLVVTG
ncbi:hypothetical protein CAEBREN_32519 [Caenorhabditis brenneri]|uniref:G-protein coupled receptors family 1 profile domain-containing protein n=1 Tax=Caenorhabditis brenneri TaxID=135651 RepID=G0NAA5_CAEBE|nr:hypothetical protein CAEBREN_32519 [Caenorhabditis brenneri]